jgi:hypothetical protein
VECTLFCKTHIDRKQPHWGSLFAENLLLHFDAQLPNRLAC